MALMLVSAPHALSTSPGLPPGGRSCTRFPRPLPLGTRLAGGEKRDKNDERHGVTVGPPQALVLALSPERAGCDGQHHSVIARRDRGGSKDILNSHRRPPKPPTALVVTMDGTITAVKADTGSKLWSMDLNGPLLSSWQNDTVFQDISIVPNTGCHLHATPPPPLQHSRTQHITHNTSNPTP